MRQTLAMVLALSVGLALAGPRDNSLIIGSAQEPANLNFWTANAVIQAEIGQYLFRGLTYVDMDGNVQADLAEKVPSPQNGLVKITRDARGAPVSMTVRWTLRDDAKWSDGSAITTRDIVFSYATAMDDRIPVASRANWPRSVKAVDDRTFEETYSPAFPFYQFGTYPVLPLKDWKPYYDKAAQAAAGKSLAEATQIFQEQFLAAPLATSQRGPRLTSGPFRFVGWRRGQNISLVRNKNYWFKPAYGEENAVQRVTYLFFANENTLLVNVLSGKVDALANTGVSDNVQNYTTLKSRARGYDVKLTPQSNWEHLDLNKFTNVQEVKDLGLDDKRTRQALTYAINRKGMSEQLLGGLVRVSNQFVNSASPYFDKSTDGAYPYDPAKARQILASLGWKSGPDGILVRNGKRFELEYVTTAGNATRERNQQYIKQNLREVGIDVKINNAPSSVVFADNYIQRAQEGQWKGLFEFAWNSQPLQLTMDLFATDDPNTNDKNDFVPSKDNGYQGQNVGGWMNGDFQKLWLDLRDEFDTAKRKTILTKMQQLMVEELPVIPLYERSAIMVTREDLANYTYNATARYPGWNAWEIGWKSRGAK